MHYVTYYIPNKYLWRLTMTRIISLADYLNIIAKETNHRGRASLLLFEQPETNIQIFVNKYMPNYVSE